MCWCWALSSSFRTDSFREINVKKTWFSVGQIVLTLIVVVAAALVLWKLVDYYMFAPWTRVGHVRADVIHVAPVVSGLI